VHVEVIPGVLEDFQASLGGIESSKLSKKISRGIVPRSVGRRHSKVVL
jgi:hypothetical protein